MDKGEGASTTCLLMSSLDWSVYSPKMMEVPALPFINAFTLLGFIPATCLPSTATSTSPTTHAP
jgi:hypothetical protein